MQVLNSPFLTGVPDPLPSLLADYLKDDYGEDGKHHNIAANEATVKKCRILQKITLIPVA